MVLFFNAALLGDISGYVLHIDRDFIVELAFQLVNTVILIAALSWLLYEPVKNFLNARVEKIRKQIEQAENDSRTAKELRSEYDEKVRGIAAERDGVLTQARQRALEKESQIIIEAKKEAEFIRQSAQRDIELERAKVQDEIRKYILETSALIATKFIGEKIDDKARDKFFDETVKDLEASPWHN